MTLTDFQALLQTPKPPTELSPLLIALWHAGRNEWDAAHNIAQSREGTPAYDALHAYLHRVEGDEWNAGYWYRRAKRTVFAGTLQAEWEALAREFLG